MSAYAVTDTASEPVRTALKISERRLYNQRIAATSSDSAAAVVEWLGAVQAQDFPASLWAIALRMNGGTEAGVERAIAERRIVRTWPMRGTLHFVPARDARWMLRLLTPRVIRSSASRYRQLELDDAVFERSRSVITAALRDQTVITRTDFYQRLERAGISTQGARGLHIIGHLAQQGVICFGSRAGKQPTLTLLDEWVTDSRDLTGDEALAELAQRYFNSHGPATVHDFAWWSGLTITEARRAIAAADQQLHSEELDGTSYWLGTCASAKSVRAPRAFLLPAYDEYTVAYRDRSAVLAPEHAARASAGGILYPTIVFDGRVIGTWRRELGKRGVAITLRPFARLQRSRLPAIRDAAARYAAFLDRDLAAVHVEVAD